ncbi:hypothetical protein DL95DRAFT_347946 [Leptodontidium sp. 2 PMI_412]|nr:hypothetical protein DL95DRAFT_347946 [Leptodontidium sp. 2 PMI_412]
MVPSSLMFRVFTASRQAHLRPGKSFLRSFHNTATLRSIVKPASGDLTADLTRDKPEETILSTVAEPPSITQAIEEAVDDILKAAKTRATKAKKKVLRAAEDGVPPKKPRKKAIPSAVAHSDSTSLPPVPDSPTKPQKQGGRGPGQPKKDPNSITTEPEKESKSAPAERKKFLGHTRPEEPRNDITEYLRWGYGGNWQGAKPLGDRRRMNIVSEDACDAVLARLKPSLERHMGCDILDINPGAGVWSAKLHDFLKPRTHILLEPDTKMYGPLLDPLVMAPNSTYKLVPKSGLVWGHLEGVLSQEYLPLQTARKRDDPRVEERNDTLLVTANLGYSPKKPYKGFTSLAQMVIYQFMGAVTAHSLFQKYGLVRMLVWINDEEKHNILPRTIGDRRKASVEAGFACEKVEEVASSTVHMGHGLREPELDLQSGREVLQRMANSGIQIPEGRESILVQQLNGADVPNSRIQRFQAVSSKEETAAAIDDPQKEKMRQNRLKSRLAGEALSASVCDTYEDILKTAKVIHDSPDSEEQRAYHADFWERLRHWEMDVSKLSRTNRHHVQAGCDNRLAIRRDQPLLLWDRREIEPIRLDKHEFFPARTMCLFDIQPKTLIPILRDNYPNNYDILEFLLGSFYTLPSQSVRNGLIGLWPGAYEWIDAECPSLKDIRKGGHPDLNHLTVRMLSDEMMVEMVDAWLRWPFKPTRYQMLSRMGSATHDAAGVMEVDD